MLNISVIAVNNVYGVWYTVLVSDIVEHLLLEGEHCYNGGVRETRV